MQHRIESALKTFEFDDIWSGCEWAQGDGRGGQEENIGYAASPVECATKVQEYTGHTCTGATMVDSGDGNCYCEYGVETPEADNRPQWKTCPILAQSAIQGQSNQYPLARSSPWPKCSDGKTQCIDYFMDVMMCASDDHALFGFAATTEWASPATAGDDWAGGMNSDEAGRYPHHIIAEAAEFKELIEYVSTTWAPLLQTMRVINKIPAAAKAGTTCPSALTTGVSPWQVMLDTCGASG
eukprot:gene58268-biopygen22409